MNKKILIVEDEPAIAQDIAFNLEDNGFQIGNICHTSEKTLEYLFSNAVDLVLLDIHIKGSKNGIEVAKIINEKYHLPFIYLTSFSDTETVQQAAETFPYGYLVKPFKESDIVPAIITALAKFESTKPRSLPSIDDLNNIAVSPISKTEFLIVKNIFEGMTNQQIADSNFISINTVKTHINNIFIKLNVHSKIQLMSILRR